MSDNENLSTRDKLFIAAIRVFAKKGYRQATVREICKKAGSGNINSINYYFGSKELLYRKILEKLFAEYDKRESPRCEDMSPKEQLRAFIKIHCTMLYQKNKFSEDLMAIYIAEMAQPSKFLQELVDTYNRPRVKKNLAMIQTLLGPDAPPEMVRNCLVSIGGQILYYAYNWPVASRLFPDHPGMAEDYLNWAKHVYQFSMAAIETFKRQLKENK